MSVNFQRRSLRESILSLAFVQGADYLVPLLAIPYLLRVLGSGGYGQIAFVQAFCVYFVMLSDYGFGWTGTRRVAVERENRMALSATFWEIQAVKLVLVFISFMLVGIMVNTIPQLEQLSDLFWIGMLPVIGSLVYPVWFLQGVERMREAAGMMLIVRFALLAGIFVLVESKEDIHLAAILQMGATPLAGLLACIYLIRMRALIWVRPRVSGILSQIQESWHAFLAAAASNVYRCGNAVVLGFIAGTEPVAYYSLVEKLVKAVQELSRPVAQATFPRVSAYVVENREEAIWLLRKLLLGIGGLCLVLSAMLFVFASEIIHAIAGDGFDDAISILRLMSVVPLIGGLNSVLGVQTMQPFGFSREFSWFVGLAGLVDILLIVPLIYWFSAEGAAAGYIASEATLLLLLIWFHPRAGIRLFSFPFGRRP